jgi:hypothetical protein
MDVTLDYRNIRKRLPGHYAGVAQDMAHYCHQTALKFPGQIGPALEVIFEDVVQEGEVTIRAPWDKRYKIKVPCRFIPLDMEIPDAPER